MAKDAADTAPKFVPDEDLLPRDDSGGPGGPRYNGQWDDGGKVTKGGGQDKK